MRVRRCRHMRSLRMKERRRRLASGNMYRSWMEQWERRRRREELSRQQSGVCPRARGHNRPRPLVWRLAGYAVAVRAVLPLHPVRRRADSRRSGRIGQLGRNPLRVRGACRERMWCRHLRLTSILRVKMYRVVVVGRLSARGCWAISAARRSLQFTLRLFETRCTPRTCDQSLPPHAGELVCCFPPPSVREAVDCACGIEERLSGLIWATHQRDVLDA